MGSVRNEAGSDRMQRKCSTMHLICFTFPDSDDVKIVSASICGKCEGAQRHAVDYRIITTLDTPPGKADNEASLLVCEKGVVEKWGRISERNTEIQRRDGSRHV